METSISSTEVREQVSPEEWSIRCELAAVYRLVAMFGWDDLIFTHITAKIPGTGHFLINPYGTDFEDITASSLVKIDIDGNKVMDSQYDINPAGFIIHSCIHAAREDAMCVLHTHSLNGVAVSAQKEGLLPLSQFSYVAHTGLAYHDFEGFALDEDEQPRLVRDLGNNNFLILRNHGLLTIGSTIPMAFLNMHRLEAACMVQVRAQGGTPNLIPDEIQSRAHRESPQARLHKANLAWGAMMSRLNKRNPGYDS